MANFYIADTHFGHKNVIKFDNRPFSNVEEMNDEIIHRWNEVVTRGDTVYILGDFCWGKEKEWQELLPQLNGQKVLIRGNHDLKQYSAKTKSMLHGIYDYREIKDGDHKLILCHYPMLFYKHAYHDNVFMLCGHVHKTVENELLSWYTIDIRAQYKKGRNANYGQIINVGCMMPWMDYTPRTLDEILSATQKQ